MGNALGLSVLAVLLASYIKGAIFGLLTWPLLGLSVLATALGLGAFWLGLKTQDRVDQVTFNRAVLSFLAILSVWLIVRAAR